MKDDTSSDTNLPALPEDPPSLISSIKGEVDSLIVQLNLGKREAVDFVEQHKGDFKGLVETAAAAVLSGNEDSEKSAALKQKLDSLKVQLALGKMESRDALAEQREKIGSAIESTRKEWEPTQDEYREKFELAGESLQTKLDALALDVGIRTVVVEEELQMKKDQVKGELETLQKKLEPEIEKLGDSINDLADEAHKAFTGIRDNLRSLFD